MMVEAGKVEGRDGATLTGAINTLRPYDSARTWEDAVGESRMSLGKRGSPPLRCSQGDVAAGPRKHGSALRTVLNAQHVRGQHCSFRLCEKQKRPWCRLSPGTSLAVRNRGVT